MVRCDRGLQTLLTTAGAFAAFSLMAIAIGTDYWLYSSAHICNGTNLTMDDGPPPRRSRGDLTHSGLWRVCCIEARFWLLVNKSSECAQCRALCEDSRDHCAPLEEIYQRESVSGDRTAKAPPRTLGTPRAGSAEPDQQESLGSAESHFAPGAPCLLIKGKRERKKEAAENPEAWHGDFVRAAVVKQIQVESSQRQ
ncbi:hypothetical protein MG293_017010 [Ovis ammon polii]|uniref:Uncharacterized protein n=1 Tax=Ovis ammon polii TaxID=230172 RepID=A0AAD4TV91_OVIAM|nr:hypothetical protein MG293_017010 [Ovis ammon polii]KAI4556776.1 hypothetical protein MJT46_015399 [Ovis ammon polii x Ovis aries]